MEYSNLIVWVVRCVQLAHANMYVCVCAAVLYIYNTNQYYTNILQLAREWNQQAASLQGAAAFKEEANAQRTPLGSFDPNGKNKVANW